MKTPIGAWLLLFVAPAMFASNILVERVAAGWLPPLALTFWRWFFTALLAGALAAAALRAAAPTLRREWRAPRSSSARSAWRCAVPRPIWRASTPARSTSG